MNYIVKDTDGEYYLSGITIVKDSVFYDYGNIDEAIVFDTQDMWGRRFWHYVMDEPSWEIQA